METVYFNSFSGVDTHGSGDVTDKFGVHYRYRMLMRRLLGKRGGYYTAPLSGVYTITKWTNAKDSKSSSEMKRLSAGDVVTYDSEQMIISRVST